MAKTNSLLEAVKAIEPYKRKTWFDRLTKDEQLNIRDIRSRWQSGELLADKYAIYAALQGKIQLPSVETFRRWMNEK